MKKKYKLKLKYVPYCDYIIEDPEHYVVKRRYIGFFWKTVSWFRYGKCYSAKSLEQAKQEAIVFMDNYCQTLKKEKQDKIDLKKAYKEQRNWEKNEILYKTCECDK